MYGTSYQYSYDAANRLIEVKDGAGATIASCPCDGDGRRLTKTAKNSSGQFETTTCLLNLHLGYNDNVFGTNVHVYGKYREYVGVHELLIRVHEHGSDGHLLVFHH